MGFYGSKGPFWAMPPMFLTGTAAAGAIAWINSLGNLGGFFGSWYAGVMKDLTGSYAGGLYGLALFGLISAFISAFFLHIPNPCRLRAGIGGDRRPSRTGPHTRIGARCSRCAIIYQENKNAFEIRGRSDTCLRPTAAYC
jgi:MFS family permease